MRNISFSLTTPQFRARTKDVTRRMGWRNLQPGDRLMGCEKCMGRRKGEPLVRLGEIEIVSVRFEPLDLLTVADLRECGAGEWRYTAYTLEEMKREGFPGMPPDDFVTMFCASHARCIPSTIITRIEFRYL